MTPKFRRLIRLSGRKKDKLTQFKIINTNVLLFPDLLIQ